MKPTLNRAIGIATLAFGLAPALVVGLAPAGATAAPALLCPGQASFTTFAASDGRVLGHIPYGEAPPIDLVPGPPGFAVGSPCLLQRGAAADLARLMAAAANAPEVGNQLRGVSCFRSIEYQRSVFCGQVGPARQFATAAERARVVGPPAFSEHATGYAVDFTIRPSPACPDVDACITATAPGRWLLAHAPEFGFELSFPAGNSQGVTWEPWHWRWVGVTIDTPGAARARLVFARARSSFAASPAVDDMSDYRPRPSLPIPAAVSRYIHVPPLR